MATAATEQQLQQSMQQLQQSSVSWLRSRAACGHARREDQWRAPILHLKMNVTASFKQLDHTSF
jgi:hypothetical protein